MNKRKIRFGIVGCGRIAERHIESIMIHAELIAICDIDETKVNDFCTRFNVRGYDSIDAMLCSDSSNLDVVSICTPNGLHAQHSISALNHGCNVICEKPLALSTKDCLSMIYCAEKNNRRLFAIKQNRFNPPVVALKELLSKNKLGKILSVQLNCFWNRKDDYYKNSWKGSKTLDGGTLFTQFSHFLDLLLWLIGDVKKVKSLTKNSMHQSTIEFEDNGVVLLEFESGAIGSVHFTINSFNQNMEGSLTIFGEKGTVKIGGQYLNELEYQNIDSYSIEELPPGNKANNYGNYTGSMSNHELVYENLIDVITNNGIINTNAIEAMKTVTLIEEIYAESINF